MKYSSQAFLLQNDKSHYETDRFCGNSLGPPPSSQGPLLADAPDAQTVVSYKRPFAVQVVTDADELTARSVDSLLKSSPNVIFIEN